MSDVTCRIKPFIKPFERELALRELSALTGDAAIPLDGDRSTASVFRVRSGHGVEELRASLAYWSSVGEGPGGITGQARREATLELARSAKGQGRQIAIGESHPLRPPSRRCLRYGTHGLHEYRGKFFPQLVRALMNIGRLPKGALVLDPMCGSGTTLVEARLSGRRSVGLDMNPLSVLITDVKCRALEVAPEVLFEANGALRQALRGAPRRGSQKGRLSSLAESDRDYLRRWFAPPTLEELDSVDAVIAGLRGEVVRDFYRVCLSNILRGVSWQKSADLRVRREQKEIVEGETVARFLDEADRSTRTVGTFLAERGGASLGEYTVTEADARGAGCSLGRFAGRVDAIVTSPPYATALPYIDTDRLSLVYLGLLPRGEHRRRDGMMIGNREVTKREREENWQLYENGKSLLPCETRDLVERIDYLNKIRPAGFRRGNLSALLARYFLDMREVLGQMWTLLRPGGSMFVVVGNNRTTAGGEEVEIETADHLREIARQLGYRVREEVAMDMLASRDIFRNNAMRSERILRFEKRPVG